MRRYWAWALGAALMAVTLGVVLRPREAALAAAPAATAGNVRGIVGAGRVEPASEELRIGTEIDGRLRSVPVEEGDSVKRGQVLALIENGDYAARVALAESNLRQAQAAVVQAQASLERLRNGSRPQERREAEASVREAEAVLRNATVERDRRRTLLDRGAISRTEFDTADREYSVALARLDAIRERRNLVEDATRVEDTARARGALAEAEARVDEMRARVREAREVFAKTEIRSPIDGVVLRKKLKAGESVARDGGAAIVTLGDTARLRVRVDVDETDVAGVYVGQPAWVTAKAYGERKFTGRVVRVGQILGRKNIRTDEPTERVDTKILETLVELDEGQVLPSGLRVDAYLQPKEGR